MDTDAQELAELRRLLKERAVRLEALEAFREQVGRAVLSSDKSVPAEALEMGPILAALESVRAEYSGQLRERSERILHVFGCAGCGGEHRSIWTQALGSPVPVNIPHVVQPVLCQRAYICPASLAVVLVSNESEETFRFFESDHG
jgi:hypothetical protein